MSESTLRTRPIGIRLDPTPDGRILLVAIDDDLRSFVLRFTAPQAARFAHALYDMAKRLESP